MMTVHGMGEVSIEPDTASVMVEVVTQNQQISMAQKENANQMNNVIQALLQMGISNENLQTTAYAIQPLYDYVEGTQVFRTFEVRNSLEITIHDIDLVGAVIDVAIESGANRVSNIQFMLKNREEHDQLALNDALRNAQVKAQMIAESLTISFDPIPIKIVEEKRDEIRPFRLFAATEDSLSTPIQPGQIEIKARVEVQFQY